MTNYTAPVPPTTAPAPIPASSASPSRVAPLAARPPAPTHEEAQAAAKARALAGASRPPTTRGETGDREPVYPVDRLTITAWPDPVVEAHGHDPRSEYVELYWLGILGPSTTLLLRHLARLLEHQPEGFTLDLVECANALGLGGKGGRHSPFMRSLRRATQFGLARELGPEALQVRTHMPPLTRGQLARISPQRQVQHDRHLQAALAAPRPANRPG